MKMRWQHFSFLWYAIEYFILYISHGYSRNSHAMRWKYTENPLGDIYIYIDLNFSSIFYKNIEDFFVKAAAEKKWGLVEEANRKKSEAKELELKIKETEESLQRQKKIKITLKWGGSNLQLRKENSEWRKWNPIQKSFIFCLCNSSVLKGLASSGYWLHILANFEV